MTNKKVLFSKWMKHLYTVHLVLLACSVLATIPLIGVVFKWGSSLFWWTSTWRIGHSNYCIVDCIFSSRCKCDDISSAYFSNWI